jgi:hypothetical protein
MLLIAEIAMLVLGIITVATGKLSISAGKECRGAPARVAGVLMILQLPVAIVVVVGLMMVLAAHGRIDPTNPPGWFVLLELGIFLVFIITAFVIAGVNAQPIGTYDRARRRRDYPDERGYGGPDRGEEDYGYERPRRPEDPGYDQPRPPDDRIR